jgi:tetratricopeptide (TPR) repeat protein
MRFFQSWLVTLLCVSPIAAQQVGDTVIVTAQTEADVKIGERVVDRVARATPLTVDEVGATAYRVWCNGLSGWVAKRDVASIDEAIRVFTEAIEHKPIAGDYFGRGLARYFLGDLDKADADFKQAIRIAPKFAGAYNALGEVQSRNTRDLDKAIASYAEAIRLEPEFAEAFCGRGAALLRKGDIEKAVADYTQAIRLNSELSEAYNGRAAALLRKADFDRAVADYSESIRLRSRDATAWYGRGFAYCSQGDYDKAIADHTEAIRLNPEYVDAYTGRALASLHKGNLVRAIEDYTEAIRLDPKNADAYDGRGGAYALKCDWERAVSDFSNAIQYKPMARTYFNRGVAYATLIDEDKAIADFSEALRCDPKFYQAYLSRASAHTRSEHYDCAIDDANEAIRLNPRCPEAYSVRAEIYWHTGELDKALADFTRLIELNPKNARARYCRALLYEQKGDFAKAIAELDTAVKSEPTAALYYEARGAFRIVYGAPQEGTADIQAAIRLDPNDPARKFEAWPKASISEKALAYGLQQVKQMLKDRPEMKRHGDKAAALYQWAAHKFAGEDLGQRVLWDATEPDSPFDCQSGGAEGEQPGRIRVRSKYCEGPNKGKERSFEEMWSNAIFELYNIGNTNDFRSVAEEAKNAGVSKALFVQRMSQIESQASKKMRAFYIHVFLPWSVQNRVNTNPFLWSLARAPDDAGNVILPYMKKGAPYRRFYEEWYDSIRSDK